jgi:protein-tyrosine phosphatase
MSAVGRKRSRSDYPLRLVVDLHSHILHGVDDGPQSLEEAVEIASAAVAEGVLTMVATPHVRDDFPTEPETMELRLAELRQELGRRSIPLNVLPGGEVALDRLPLLGEGDLRRFALAGNPSYVLVEMPYFGWPLDLNQRAFHLQALGITPVLAHPERNADVQAAPERLDSLVRAGWLVQVTAASVDGRLGRSARRSALQLIERGLAHIIASDAHTAAIRGVGMAAAAAAVRDRALARWLTEDVPGAIVADEPLPERPAPAARRLRLRRS